MQSGNSLQITEQKQLSFQFGFFENFFMKIIDLGLCRHENFVCSLGFFN